MKSKVQSIYCQCPERFDIFSGTCTPKSKSNTLKTSSNFCLQSSVCIRNTSDSYLFTPWRSLLTSHHQWVQKSSNVTSSKSRIFSFIFLTFTTAAAGSVVSPWETSWQFGQVDCHEISSADPSILSG